MTCIGTKLQQAGYATHMVGKWHCGLATNTHTPHGRGYNTSLNYFDAANDYWTSQFSSCLDKTTSLPTLTDLWDTTHPAIGSNNSWACSQANQAKDCIWEDDRLQARLLSTIDAHDPTTPLFLFWSAHTVHEPYEVPDADLARFAHIDVKVRKFYASMVSHLDGLVPAVVGALKAKGMWENTLWITTSDNGGPLSRMQPGDSLDNVAGANNYPLRGGKIGVLEGGIRLNAFVSGGFIPQHMRGSSVEAFMHLCDWYTTFCALAGADPYDHQAADAGLPPVDGLDMSPVIMGVNTSSPRHEIVIGSSDNTDHLGNTIVAGIIDSDGWKLLIESRVSPAFWQGDVYPNSSSAAGTQAMPNKVLCGDPQASGDDKGPGCLFNVLTDPSEYHDLALQHPDIVTRLRTRIAEHQSTVYSPDRGTHDRDMCLTGLDRHNGFLGPWLP